MSDNVPRSSYAGCPTDSYDHEFRVLVTHLFMDDLTLAQIEKFFFIYELPERLRDNGPSNLRCEVLTYVRHQLLIDAWSETPSDLQKLLKELGRVDLSAKVQAALVGK